MKTLIGCSLLAACLATSACTSPSEAPSPAEATRASAVAAAGGDPYKLPDDLKPPLFDPCTEIPAGALAEAGFGPGTLDSSLTLHEEGRLLACNWHSDFTLFGVAASWKSREQDRIEDRYRRIRTINTSGRRIELVHLKIDTSDRACHGILYTSHGSLVSSVSLSNLLNEFKGKRWPEPCDALEQILIPIAGSFPEEFRK